jgi:hypothetical protein
MRAASQPTPVGSRLMRMIQPKPSTPRKAAITLRDGDLQLLLVLLGRSARYLRRLSP